jgi:dTDP-4-dehydrorhamnose 3,5-epimerase
MKILKTNIPEVLIFSIDVYRDNRGHFLESYNYKNYKKYLSDVSFVQDNESTSKKGVLRGLHYQESPKSQAKLIRVIKGRIQDVAVDIRKDSPTFKQYVSIELNENNHHQLFIPSGFAHGFLVLSDEAVIQYKVNNNYESNLDRGYRYNDPSFNIKWMLDDKKIILSEKDKELPFLK